MILKTGKVEIISVSALKDMNNNLFFKRANEIRDWFNEVKLSSLIKSVADIYQISKRVGDYIFVVARAVTANIPNENLDAFRDIELLKVKDDGRFCYETFQLTPLLEEHDYSNIPAIAGGFVVDAYFDDEDEDDKKVMTLIAVDTVKKNGFAKDLLSGHVKTFSMGCVCGQTRCSVCNNVAKSEAEYCNHIKNKFITRQAFEWCEDVWYRELSIVRNPADKKAISHHICYYDKEGIKCL